MIAEVLGDGKGVQWPISPAIPGEQKISDQFARRFYQFGDIYLISCLLDLLGMIGSRRQYICLIVGSPEPEAWFNICPIESTICLANELYFGGFSKSSCLCRLLPLLVLESRLA